VMHHVKEEEGEMFAQLERARLDWLSLADETNDRRASLLEEDEQEVDTEDGPKESPQPRSSHPSSSNTANE
jgi:hypothetical protein